MIDFVEWHVGGKPSESSRPSPFHAPAAVAAAAAAAAAAAHLQITRQDQTRDLLDLANSVVLQHNRPNIPHASVEAVWCAATAGLPGQPAAVVIAVAVQPQILPAA